MHDTLSFVIGHTYAQGNVQLVGMIHATSPQEYWTLQLPETPIPESIQYMLPHAGEWKP